MDSASSFGLYCLGVALRDPAMAAISFRIPRLSYLGRAVGRSKLLRSHCGAVAALGLSMADEQEAAVGKMVLHGVDLCDATGLHVCGF